MREPGRADALQLTEPGRLEVVALGQRELLPGEARVHVEAAGICGSDIHGFAGLNDRRPVGVVMGHETVGRVLEGGDPRRGLGPGARVAINPILACGRCEACGRGEENLCEARRIFGCVPGLPGGLATEITVPAASLVAVDESADLRGVVLAEPFAVATHAVRIADIQRGERVLVVGGGPIGFAVALALGDRGVDLAVSEPTPERRAALAAFGIPTCEPAGVADRGPCDVAFECVGVAATFRAAVDAVRTGGRVIALGIADREIPVPAAALVIGERRLIGSSAYTAADFAASVALVSTHAARLAVLVEAVPTLEGMARAFQGYRDGTRTAFKTAYLP